MSRKFKISELIFDNEDPNYRDDERLKKEAKTKMRQVNVGDRVRHLTRLQSKDVKSITTPEGRELTPEELFSFVIGENITDLARTSNISENAADIAIVLGNIGLPTTRERAIKAFALYKLGLVKKIIFTGGISKERDKKGFIHPNSLESYMSDELVEGLQWEDLPEADWGAETFVQDVFEEDYQEHSPKLTEEFLESVGVNPADVLTEALSSTTQENAEFCKNIFDTLQLETGDEIKKAILVTTCTHGNRATMQFRKVFGDKINLKWCPSTLDLEKFGSLKNILRAPKFDERAFKRELKRLYCTEPVLIQQLRTELAEYRNVFIRELIDEPEISTDEPEIVTPDNEKEGPEL